MSTSSTYQRVETMSLSGSLVAAEKPKRCPQLVELGMAMVRDLEARVQNEEARPADSIAKHP